jgi:hypothetical protein
MLSKSNLLILGAAAIGLASTAGFAVGQQFGLSGPGSQLGMPQYMRGGTPTALAALGNNQGIYVEKDTFQINMGSGEATPEHIARMKAQEVSHGAIIFRSGDKLYLVDWKKGE